MHFLLDPFHQAIARKGVFVMPGHALEIADVPAGEALQVFTLVGERDRKRAAQRRPACVRISGRVLWVGAGRRPVMNARAEEEDALSFPYRFGDGVQIVHRLSRQPEG
ncbi:MAG TPA: hypothetical protein VH252_07955 [Chthoniobacterales bacterium]|nr:hypothetical protein [Chthoniobacterales bacterium]